MAERLGVWPASQPSLENNRGLDIKNEFDAEDGLLSHQIGNTDSPTWWRSAPFGYDTTETPMDIEGDSEHHPFTSAMKPEDSLKRTAETEGWPWGTFSQGSVHASSQEATSKQALIARQADHTPAREQHCMETMWQKNGNVDVLEANMKISVSVAAHQDTGVDIIAHHGGSGSIAVGTAQIAAPLLEGGNEEPGTCCSRGSNTEVDEAQFKTTERLQPRPPRTGPRLGGHPDSNIEGLKGVSSVRAPAPLLPPFRGLAGKARLPTALSPLQIAAKTTSPAADPPKDTASTATTGLLQGDDLDFEGDQWAHAHDDPLGAALEQLTG